MQSIAEKVKEHIKNYDRLVDKFGMEIEEVTPGYARVSLDIKDEHLNSADVCHGATIFALADVAFALSCNSHGRMALALEVSINFLRPASIGGRLTAVSREAHLGRTTGLYTINVTDQAGKNVAFLKATAYRFDQSLVK